MSNRFLLESGDYTLNPEYPLSPEQNRAVEFTLTKFNCVVGLQTGLGKCVKAGTRLQTEFGYLPIETLMLSRKEGFTPFEIKVSTRYGEMKTSNYYYEKNCFVKTFSLRDGSEVNGTLEHRILSYNSNGDVELVKMEKLKKGSLILKSSNRADWETSSHNRFSNFENYIIGLFMGDGCIIEDKRANKLRFYIEGEESYMRDLENHEWTTSLKSTVNHTWRILIKEKYASVFREMFPNKQDSSSKRVPEVIFKGSWEQKMYFILGYLDSDGTFSGNTLEFISKSIGMSKDMVDLMESCGLQVKLVDKVLTTGKYKGNSYKRFRIISNSYNLFEYLNYYNSRKLAKIKEFLSRGNSCNNVDFIIIDSNWVKTHLEELEYVSRGCDKDGIDNLRQIYRDIKKGRRKFSKTRLRKIEGIPCSLSQFMNYHAVEVLDEVISREDVYDIEVLGVHEFMAQGLANHNTYTALTAAQHILNKTTNTVCFVVCPKAANTSFKKELAYKLKVPYSIYTTEEKAMRKGSRYILFNYSNIKDMIKYLLAVKAKGYKVFLIADELHQLQGEDSQLTKVIRKFRSEFACVIGLTATPLLNKLLGTYRCIDFVRPGFLGTEDAFKARYIIYKERTGKVAGGRTHKFYDIAGYQNLEELSERLKGIVIIEKLYYNISWNYRSVALTTYEELQYSKAADGILNSDEAERELAGRLHDLQRVADGSHIELDSDSIYSKGKLLISVIKECLQRDEGCLVYTEYEDTYTMLGTLIEKFKGYLGYRKLHYITGKTAYAKRIDVEKMLRAGDIVVMTRAGIQSINLQAVNNVIFYNTPFSVGYFIQCLGRVTRMDSKYTSQNVYILEAQDTIDTYKRLLIQEHASIIEVIFGKEGALPDLGTMDTETIRKFKSYFKRKLLWKTS